VLVHKYFKNSNFDYQCFASVALTIKGAKLALSLLLISMAIVAYLFVVFTIMPQKANAASRLKDIVAVEGIRDNVLVGYGLVVGLNGTGDKLRNSVFTEKSLLSFMSKLGVNVGENSNIKVKNVAAVTITANLPAFARSGSKIDITVSAIGDASSLQGGVLVTTPLMGADGETYAVAQGAIAIGGFQAQGDSTVVSKGSPTSGFISSGATIEREIDFDLNSMRKIKLALMSPDITTARRISKVINNHFKNDAVSIVLDPGTVILNVNDEYREKVAYLLSEIEGLKVDSDNKAKIIIDEASGTVVINENVKIDKVAVAQGNLIVTIKEDTKVSQPASLAPEGAEVVQVADTSVDVEEKFGKIAVMKENATLEDLVFGLNSLGVGPRDLINILQNIKAAGALHASIEAR